MKGPEGPREQRPYQYGSMQKKKEKSRRSDVVPRELFRGKDRENGGGGKALGKKGANPLEGGLWVNQGGKTKGIGSF